MPLPNTTGTLLASPTADAKKGDYFAFKYSAGSGAIGTFPEMFAEKAVAQANEIPTTGVDAPSGYAYAINVGPGKFVSDRVVQRNVSWINANLGKVIQGLYNYVRNNNISFELVETVTGITADLYLKSVGLRNARTICMKVKEHTSSYTWNGFGDLRLLLNNADINPRKMKSLIHPAPYMVFADSEYDRNNYYSWKAFDNDSTTGWLSDGDMASIFLDMGVIKQFDSYQVRTPVAGDGGTHAKGWDFSISTQPFGFPYLVRSLTGGVSYQDGNNKPTLTAAWLGYEQLDFQQGSFGGAANPYTKIYGAPLVTDTIGFRIGAVVDQTMTEVEIYDEKGVNIASQATISLIQSPALTDPAGLTNGNKDTYVWDNVADMDGVLFTFPSKKNISKVCVYGHSTYSLKNVYLVKLPSPELNVGCFPTNNEFDSILRYSDLDGAITPNDDAVWHHAAMRTWCQDTPRSNITGSPHGYRIARNEKSTDLYFAAGSVSPNIGFRPVFEFLPQNTKATSLWY